MLSFSTSQPDLPEGISITDLSPTPVEELGVWLQDSFSDARALFPSDLNEYRRYRPIAGWRFSIATGYAGRRTLDLLVDGGFPESLPLVFLRNKPPLNEWPHVESNGKLCVSKEGETISGRSVAEVGLEILHRAKELIDAAASGENWEDLKSEALSYWGQSVSLGNPKILSLLGPRRPTRAVVACRYRTSFVVAEDEAQLHRWLRHSTGEKCEDVRFFPAVIGWLPEPPMPGDYPKNLDDLEKLLGTQAPDAGPLLQAAFNQLPDYTVVVIGSPTSSGPCLMGAFVKKGEVSQPIPGRRRQQDIPGFSHGKAPAKIAAMWWRGGARVDRCSVERIDSSWIHGRDRDPRLPGLREKRVAILGCGSVGSPVAECLASAGVGNLVLVDPQSLGSANIGRHELGADDLLRPKAGALAARIRRRYPHIESVIDIGEDWQDVVDKMPEVLAKCDLIVSAIGIWSDEWALNRWHIAGGRKQPILYCWTETNAAAGHAVHIGQNGGCFACGFNAGGAPRCRITDWPEEAGILPEPACGGSFSPYGPVELSWVTALASELALDILTGTAPEGLHRAWTAREAYIQSMGGRWSESWLSADASRTAGGRIFELEWPEVGCPVCKSTIS